MFDLSLMSSKVEGALIVTSLVAIKEAFQPSIMRNVVDSCRLALLIVLTTIIYQVETFFDIKFTRS